VVGSEDDNDCHGGTRQGKDETSDE